jgi:hypothetical protein
MKTIFSNIKVISGVIGISIFKDDGTLVAYDFPESYDSNPISEIGTHFLSLKQILPEFDEDVIYLCFEYETLHFFYFSVIGGWINVISNESLPIPVLLLTMSAVSKKFPEIFNAVSPVPAQTDKSIKSTDTKTIDILVKLLSKYLGPATLVLFGMEVQKLGYSLKDIPRNRLKEVLDNLVAKVPVDKKDEALKELSSLSLND